MPQAVITCLLLISCLFTAAQVPSREYQLKAAFLFNFTQFVEWPETSFPTIETPWVIGVLGENPFGSYLEELVSGETVNGRQVTVNYFKEAEAIQSCHIIFINLPDPKQQELALTGIAGKNILTISDHPDFASCGGMIRLFTRENKIKIQVNLQASKAANLVISSKLLKLAEIFIP